MKHRSRSILGWSQRSWWVFWTTVPASRDGAEMNRKLILAASLVALLVSSSIAQVSAGGQVQIYMAKSQNHGKNVFFDKRTGKIRTMAHGANSLATSQVVINISILKDSCSRQSVTSNALVACHLFWIRGWNWIRHLVNSGTRAGDGPRGSETRWTTSVVFAGLSVDQTESDPCTPATSVAVAAEWWVPSSSSSDSRPSLAGPWCTTRVD